MKKIISCFLFTGLFLSLNAQDVMTPELLWKLGKVTGKGITKDGKSVVYTVKTTDITTGASSTQQFVMPLTGGSPAETADTKELLVNKNISPDGKYILSDKDVKINNVFGKDFYPQLDKSDVMVYDDLNYRHWDTWEDGAFNHVFYAPAADNKNVKDIMAAEPHDCPLKPYGGPEDYTWHPDSKHIIYVTKKKAGKEYALSTNTDIYSYDIESGATTDITKGMDGYDTKPSYSSTGMLAWLSMKNDGYESDKNDIIILNGTEYINLTAAWDGTVNNFKWDAAGKKIFFTAPVDGTIQLFEVNIFQQDKKTAIKQLTNGDFDVRDIIGQSGNTLVVSRSDMNHAEELFTVDLATGNLKQLTHVNDAAFNSIKLSKTEKRYVTTTDGKKMLVWMIYPPGFDATKKYPTLLYCQGGPQSALTQYYSFRWNFQLMAANGYIIVAPNRRGMPGHGVKWNEEISKDFGGQAMRDYLSAIDDASKESFVDKNRLGCVGASYGGYSVFYLAGIHEKRFKTFISHDGIFNFKSMYGTTEEMWFVNWDIGGPYWKKENAVAQKAYDQFDPINLVSKWDTPILIIQGGRDYRVPVGQAQEAFQAAQLMGIKSRFLYFPNENHWVLQPQNALVWQHEFFRWLKETL